MSQRVHRSSSLLGSQLASRYEIRALIGRGGMGEVYEAVDRQLDRTVAVKVLRPELAADGRFLARFRREARTVARLSHPGIVGVHDIGEDGGRAFIVMEFVPGRTLGSIAHEGGADPAWTARIGASVADALAHAHDRGVVHRDIAPGNIMVTPSGAVKVLDFGIARAARGSSRSGSPSAHGTAAYVAPEQARGEASDQRADVYALGAVLYELLSGRPPFTADTTVELMERAHTHAPIPVSSICPGVPEVLNRVIERCLAKDPAARYARADELARALREAATASSAGEALARADRQHPTATAPIVRPATAVLPPFVSATTSRSKRRSGRMLAWASAALLLAAGAWVAVPALSAISADTIRPHVRGPDPVPTPTGLAASTSCDGLFSTRTDLSWTPGGPSRGYEIWRSEPGVATYQLVARIHDWRVTTFTDAGLGVDLTYHYLVRAVAGARVSPPTHEVRAPTPLLCLA